MSLLKRYAKGFLNQDFLRISRIFLEAPKLHILKFRLLFRCLWLNRTPRHYAARCAEKLRQQGTVASIVGVFLNTNAFREDLPQYWNFQEMRLTTPSSSTVTIVKAANEVLQKLYRQGYHYKKAGVIVMGIGPNSPIQPDLFDYNAEQFEKMKRLDAVIDRINKVNGTETIVLGSQQYTQKDGKGKANVFANAIKHDFKSKNPTTRWSDIIVLK